MRTSRVAFLQGMLFLFTAQFMVGINIVFSKYLLDSVPAEFILALRFALAAIILFPLHWLTPASKMPLKEYFSRLKIHDWKFITAQALCAGVFFNVLMLWGLKYTDASVAGIITSALPAIIALMAWLILKETISGKTATCIALAVAGLLIIASDNLASADLHNSIAGDILILISLFPEAGYYILAKLYRGHLPVFIASALFNAINAVIMLFFIGFGANDMLNITLSQWMILLLLGLSAGLFYVCWMKGCQNVDGMTASLSTAIMPVATVMIAWILLGEELTKGQTVGMGFVILSIIAKAKR